MWFNNISEIMYEKCKTDDREEYWSLITEDRLVYMYCLYVKDTPEMYNKLTENEWIFYYCFYIKDRPELWNKLTDNRWINDYCRNIKNRKEFKCWYKNWCIIKNSIFKFFNIK